MIQFSRDTNCEADCTSRTNTTDVGKKPRNRSPIVLTGKLLLYGTTGSLAVGGDKRIAGKIATNEPSSRINNSDQHDRLVFPTKSGRKV